MKISAFKEYLKASGNDNDDRIIKEYNSIINKIPNPIGDGIASAIKVKEVLMDAGFEYDYEIFLAQELMELKKGNCLGLPLLIVSLLKDSGKDAKLRVIVSPHDYTYEDEIDTLNELKDSLDYGNPKLAVEPASTRWHRFIPLEHLVVEVDDELMDTTPGEVHTVPNHESFRSMSFEQALGCMYQDRSVLLRRSDNFNEAKKLLQIGLNLNNMNREMHAQTALVEEECFNDFTYNKAVEEYLRIGGDDSLYYSSKYEFHRKKRDVEIALEKYPAYAEIIARKAKQIIFMDKRESKFLYALASQLYSMSAVLKLSDFYITHYRQLAYLFSKEIITEALLSFQDEENIWGKFDYHNALYWLNGDQEHFFEAKESLETPLQQLKLLYARYNNNIDITDKLNIMNKDYDNSFLFNRNKIDLTNLEEKNYE